MIAVYNNRSMCGKSGLVLVQAELDYVSHCKEMIVIQRAKQQSSYTQET